MFTGKSPSPLEDVNTQIYIGTEVNASQESLCLPLTFLLVVLPLAKGAKDKTNHRHWCPWEAGDQREATVTFITVLSLSIIHSVLRTCSGDHSHSILMQFSESLLPRYSLKPICPLWHQQGIFLHSAAAYWVLSSSGVLFLSPLPSKLLPCNLLMSNLSHLCPHTIGHFMFKVASEFIFLSLIITDGNSILQPPLFLKLNSYKEYLLI